LPPAISENLSPIDKCTRRNPLDWQVPNVGSGDDWATLKHPDLIEQHLASRRWNKSKCIH
jgi:hypothetical protein